MKNFTTLLVFIAFSSFSYSQQGHPQIGKIDPQTNCQIRYLYFPNLEAYFDTQNSVYIYNDKGTWLVASEIPAGYRGYSLYKMTNFPITDYDDDNILQFLNVHKQRFPYNNGKKVRDMTASAN